MIQKERVAIFGEHSTKEKKKKKESEKTVMFDEIGELLEEPGEVSGLWRIPNFLSLPEEVDKEYRSPNFIFFDSCWCLSIYPSGETRNKATISWISLYLRKLNIGSTKVVSVWFGVKNAEGDIKNLCEFNCTLLPDRAGSGTFKFLEKSDLQRRKTELLSSDALTITYTLKGKNENRFEGSLYKRLWNISKKMEKILSDKKRTDVTLKLKDGQISAHKTILESQSPVFERMFGADMLESKIGEMNIEDATVDSFGVVLSYVYSGEPKRLNLRNVTEVYRVAHKYELEELMKLCTGLMQESLGPDTICEVFALADLYQETILKGHAKDYFAKNKTEICKSENWKTFKRDNPAIAFEVLEYALGVAV